MDAEAHLGPARFRLLASAIAGRGLDVAPLADGELAWTDGTTIFVGADTSVRDSLQCLAVQASLLGAGSLDIEVVRRLGRSAAVARRYLAIEGHRALLAHEHLLPAAARSLLDRDITARTASPIASLQIALNGEAMEDPPKVFGVIRPRQLRVSIVAPRNHDASARAEHVPRRMSDASLPVLDDDVYDADAASLHMLSSPVGGSGLIGRLLGRMLANMRAPGGGPAGADAPTHRGQSSRRGARVAVPSISRVAMREELGRGEQWGVTYPEWDVHRGRYRTDWCTVVEVDPGDDGVLIAPANVHELRRALARLGVGLERRHRQLQGDDVDIDAAVEARVEAIAGSASDDAVYIDSVRGRRDLSMLLLLDISGSAAEPSATGATVHEQQRAAAAALGMALHDLGDRVALYAFRSQGRSAVQVVPVKRFDDGFGATALRRLGGLVPGAYTRIGAAIRHGAAALDRDGGTPRRLLVVVSDGFAYDHGYEGPYAEGDARRALAEARRRGIGCLCLSVGAVTDAPTLRRVFGTAAHASIATTDHLPLVVAPLFRSALRASEAQQRVSQRKERVRGRALIDRSAG